MRGLVLVALFLGALTVLPWFGARGLEGRVMPKWLANMHLFTLIGLALLPIGWLGCLAGGIGAALYPRSEVSISCWFGSSGFNFWRASTEVVALFFLARLIWAGFQVARATAEVSVNRTSFLRSIGDPAQRLKKLIVIPTDVVVAFASGIRRPRAVVSSGMLDLLEPAEQDAVIEHELAHLRLGHPRILFLGATIALAYRWLPPFHYAFNGLRRELEAAADDEVVAVCGAKVLIQALAKVGLQNSRVATASFADADTLRYRLNRLEESTKTRRQANLFGMGIIFSLVALLSWSACVLVNSASLTAGFYGCVVSSGALALYVSHPWVKHKSTKPLDTSIG